MWTYLSRTYPSELGAGAFRRKVTVNVDRECNWTLLLSISILLMSFPFSL